MDWHATDRLAPITEHTHDTIVMKRRSRVHGPWSVFSINERGEPVEKAQEPPGHHWEPRGEAQDCFGSGVEAPARRLHAIVSVVFPSDRCEDGDPGTDRHKRPERGAGNSQREPFWQAGVEASRADIADHPQRGGNDRSRRRLAEQVDLHVGDPGGNHSPGADRVEAQEPSRAPGAGREDGPRRCRGDIIVLEGSASLYLVLAKCAAPGQVDRVPYCPNSARPADGSKVEPRSVPIRPDGPGQATAQRRRGSQRDRSKSGPFEKRSPVDP